MATIPDLKRVNVKAEDLITQIQEIHIAIAKNVWETSAKYKQAADKKRWVVEFEISDFVWAVLTNDCFLVGEYNKLVARKIGPLEILEKINFKAYWLKLQVICVHLTSSMLSTLFHIGERIPIQTPNSRMSFFQPREDDANHVMKKKKFFFFLLFLFELGFIYSITLN